MVRPGEIAEAVVRLPWLSPGTAALLALARSPTAASWEAIRADPGAVLLVVRHSPALRTLANKPYIPALLANPCLLEEALHCLNESEPGWVDWDRPEVRPVYAAAAQIAQAAHTLAQKDGGCDPDAAWIAGLLAPLGWFGAAAVDPSAVGRCLGDAAFPGHPAAVQQRHWGKDAAAFARRLAQRWGLPDWLAAVVGHLNLHVEIAVRFGAEPIVFRVVQQAAGVVEDKQIGLGLVVGQRKPSTPCSVLSTQYPRDAEIDKNASPPGDTSAISPSRPSDVPLLPDLLRLSAHNLRLQGFPLLNRLESDLDDLHALLEEQRAAEAERLREQKLRALAEFAAGAGHEINNPLAVISGQAQYLLKQLQIADCGLRIEGGQTESGEARQTQLCNLQTAITNSQKTIIAQAQRVHQILRDLMQFARPPQPVKQRTDLGVLVRETAIGLEDLARQRQIGLECDAPQDALYVDVDSEQIRTALTCLLRNAIEAAPSSLNGGGWASIRLATDADRVAVAIEDNGPGPATVEREHLFDPFFSGRPAGRGRGLGLPTAWRLARQHGGDVTFSRSPDGTTRFLLTLPRAATPQTQAAA